MRWTTLILLGFAWVLGPTSVSATELDASQVEIALRPEALVANTHVTLGDVAILHTRDLPTMRRLVSLPLGRTPPIGSEGVVRREAIARWIRNQLGIRAEQVHWQGSEATQVRLLTQELPGTRLQHVADVALRDWLGARTSRYELELRSAVGNVKLPPGSVALRVRPIAGSAQPARQMLIWVDVHVDGRFVRVVPVAFRVDAFREGWVSSGRVAGGAPLAPGMVQRREVEVTGQHSGDALGTGQPEGSALPNGWQTTRTVAAGEAITLRNASPAPLVARGEWVVLKLKSGRVELENRAQVLQNGELGQVVQVRSSGGSAPIAARITASGRVEAML